MVVVGGDGPVFGPVIEAVFIVAEDVLNSSDGEVLGGGIHGGFDLGLEFFRLGVKFGVGDFFPVEAHGLGEQGSGGGVGDQLIAVETFRQDPRGLWGEDAPAMGAIFFGQAIKPALGLKGRGLEHAPRFMALVEERSAAWRSR